jgi:hypothetical protein
VRSAVSVNGVSIRLTDGRWDHITDEHGELTGMQSDVLDTVPQPDRIVVGRAGELLGLREVTPGKWLVVVYREAGADGFIITAFLTRRERALARRKQGWP